jgi:hypothetical protein
MGRSMNRTNQGTVGMGRGAAGGSNSRGGLVGGADPGTYAGGAGGGSVQSNHDLYMKNLRDSGLARGSNSRGNLVGGADSGVRKP